MYAMVKQGRSKLFWLVRPIGGMRRNDIEAPSFYIIAREGIVGLLYRSRVNDNRYRIVFFDFPLKRLPRINRRVKRKKAIGMSN